MRASTSANWYQTMLIESSGRWRFTTGLNVLGTCVATVYSTSDARIKDDVQNIPEQDAINLLKNVSSKTYTRKDMPGKRRAGFIAQDFLNLPLSLGENLTEKIIGKITPDSEDTELNALAYDRVGSPILWAVCKNLLARIEALEFELNSN